MSPKYPHPENYELPEANDLRRMRRLADLSLTEVADRTSIARSTLKGYESGDTTPRLKAVHSLFEVYAEALPEPKANGEPPKLQEDPHDIIPPEFRKFYRSLDQAMAYMNEDTPEEEKPRCGECGSTDLRFKPGYSGVAEPCKHRKPGNWYCKSCRTYLEEVVRSSARTTDGDGGEVGT